MIEADLQSPASECAAAWINLLVTPLIAETTTKTLPSCEAARIISTTLPMHDASATDVPPNFITRSGFAPSPWARGRWRCRSRSEENVLEAVCISRGSAEAEEELTPSNRPSISRPTLDRKLSVLTPPLVGAVVGGRR